MSPAPFLELLVAHDDDVERDVLGRIFARDFVVRAVRDGTEAVRHLELSRPAAILVHQALPDFGSEQVLNRARALYPEVPRLLVTDPAGMASAVEAINAGVVHRFLTRPLASDLLRTTVIELVTRAQADEALRVELATLRAIKVATDETAARQTRVVVCGADAELGDRVAAAAVARGFLVVRVTGVDALQAALTEASTDVAVILDELGLDVRALARLVHAIDEVTAVVVVDAEPRLAAALVALEVGAVDYLAAPVLDTATLGVRLERAASRPRSQRDMRRLTFDLIMANRDLALAQKRVQAEQVQLLNAMIRALEARDSYTAGHTDRVAAIAVRCGESLGLPAARLDVIRMGALLHDVGKIGIRDDILLKPARLTHAEYEVIKTHATIGAQLLGDIEQFQCIMPIVRGHHEKLDGTGYPDGLMAAQIALEVRVVSASDVLDAVTSTRPYRRGTGIHEAFEILDSATGKHLDPDVVAALKDLHRAGRLVELLQPAGESAAGPGPYRE